VTLTASSFLAGSILSLLIPVFLLIALVVWYVKFIRRVPETGEGEDAAAAAAAAAAVNPGPDAAPATGHNPGPAAPGGAMPPPTGQTPAQP
jgi:hypothetical protein